MNADVSTESRINWYPYGPDYIAGYLPGESGYNYSYAIHVKWKRGRKIYSLLGPRFDPLFDWPSLESAKLFAERMEINK
jgi:hypothetical protein